MFPGKMALGMLGRRDAETAGHGMGVSGAVRGLVGLGVVGALTGFVGNFSNPMETTVAAEGGEGTIERVFPLEKSCYGGMDVMVENATARIDHKPFGVSFGIWTKTSYTGVITSEICTNDDSEKAVVHQTIDFSGNNPKITLTVPVEAFTATVYQKDPTDPKAFDSDSGGAWAVYSGFSELAEGLPGNLSLPGKDETENVAGGLALASAFLTASEGCAQEVWPYLEPILEEGMIDEQVRDHNFHNPEQPITDADVTAVLPSADEIHFPDQYEDWWNDHNARLKGEGVTFELPDPNDLQCEASNNIVIDEEK